MELNLAGYTMAYDLPISSTSCRYEPADKLLSAEYVHIHTAKRFSWFAKPLFNIDGYDCRRDDFLGAGNDYSRPDAVVNNTSGNHKGYHDYLVSAFKKEVTLFPGESKTFYLIAGVSKSLKERKRLISAYSNKSKITKAITALSEEWKRRRNLVSISTPDEGVNLYVNTWLKSAVEACVTWVRGPASNSNFGYRDVLQDAKGIVKFAPERTRRNILRALPYQFKDGSALRQWASEPEHHDRRKFADSPLWLSFAICAYIKETGDLSILKEKRDFLDGDNGTCYEHMLRGLRKIGNDTGSHGLPKIWEGDWNDGIGKMGADGKGESVWLAMALVAANKEAIELAEFIGDSKVVKELGACNQRITKAINKDGWDGEWYRRGFTDKGRAVGTKKDDEVTLWLNTQVWALLAGVADKKRTEKIRNIVEKRLHTPVGYILFDPPFKRFRPDIGYYSNLIPKQWVYIHSNAFKIAAERAAGFGDAAYKTLSLILPVNHAPEKL